MTVPAIVENSLGGESIAADVSLGGTNRLFVTPTRTLIFRGEGLISDETVEEYPHNAIRVTVDEKRRKTKLTLEYDREPTRSFSVPSSHLEAALLPVLAGVMNASSVTDPGETVQRAFRFSELTLVVTSNRLIKHIGQSVWDEEYDEFAYENVTGLDFEEGSVATQVVLVVNGRPERIKLPNDAARDVTQTLESALYTFFDVSDREEFLATVTPEEDEPAEKPDWSMSFDDGLEPLQANIPDETDAQDTHDPLDTSTMIPDADAVPREDAGMDSVVEHADAAAIDQTIAQLRDAVEKQERALEELERSHDEIRRRLEELAFNRDQ